MILAAAYNELPEASAWMLGFMIVFAILLLPIMPFIHRKRRMREQVELHKRIQEATAKILEDGKIEGPKGPYVKHVPWDVGTEAGTPRDGPPRTNAYHGSPWPR